MPKGFLQINEEKIFPFVAYPARRWNENKVANEPPKKYCALHVGV